MGFITVALLVTGTEVDCQSSFHCLFISCPRMTSLTGCDGVSEVDELKELIWTGTFWWLSILDIILSRLTSDASSVEERLPAQRGNETDLHKTLHTVLKFGRYPDIITYANFADDRLRRLGLAWIKLCLSHWLLQSFLHYALWWFCSFSNFTWDNIIEVFLTHRYKLLNITTPLSLAYVDYDMFTVMFVFV